MNILFRSSAWILLITASIAGNPGCDRAGNKSQSEANAAGVEAGSTGEKKQAPPLVEVTCPRRGVIRDTISVNGDLKAEHTVVLTSQVSCIAQSVPYREGDSVAAGDLLLQLDDRELRLTASREECASREAKERAAAAALDLREARESESLQKLAKERAAREFARFERMLAAEGRKAFSDEEFESKKFALQEAESAYEKAKLAAERLDIEKALAEIAAESARLASEKTLLDVERCAIRAPIGGQISLLSVKPGELVQTGQAVATVVNFDRLYSEVRIPQRRLRSLSIGQPVEITSEIDPDEEYAGKVEVIHPTIDPKEGTIKVRIAVDDPGNRLRPGMYITATVVTEVCEQALLLPKRARIFDGDESIVFVVRDNRAVRLPVRTGLSTVDELQALEPRLTGGGLAPDPAVLRDSDRLVIRGQNGLKDGMEVLIEEKTAAPPVEPALSPAAAATASPPSKG